MRGCGVMGVDFEAELRWLTSIKPLTQIETVFSSKSQMSIVFK